MSMVETRMTVEDYMRLPYRMEVYWDQNYWAAEFPELPGLAAGHEEWRELEGAIEDAKRAYFEAAIDDNRPLPLPHLGQELFSGKFVVRLPKTLHRQAAWTAEHEGVSLNSFVIAAVAKALGRAEALKVPAAPRISVAAIQVDTGFIVSNADNRPNAVGVVWASGGSLIARVMSPLQSVAAGLRLVQGPVNG